MRVRTKLRAFELADRLALLFYERTRSFTHIEQFAINSRLCIANS